MTHPAAPLSVSYGGATYYYVTNLQGDVVAILNSSGTSVVTYTYDAWGKLLTTSGSMASTLGVHNPLRYRGYVYDPEFGLYYLQSRYYNPTLGRFINADELITTGQGLLGSNVFAYCLNNPVCLHDPEGTRPVGFGLQFDVSAGEETIGVEVVVYYDPVVSGGDGPDVVYYVYSGSDLSSDNLTFMEDMVGMLASIAAIEAGPLSTDAILFAAKAFLEGVNFSGSFFLIDGNDGFTKPDDYSGAFETYSFTGTFMGKQAGMYYSFSSTCCTVGIKVGIDTTPGLLPINFSYSRTEYSKAQSLFGVMKR